MEDFDFITTEGLVEQQSVFEKASDLVKPVRGYRAELMKSEQLRIR